MFRANTSLNHFHFFIRLSQDTKLLVYGVGTGIAAQRGQVTHFNMVYGHVGIVEFAAVLIPRCLRTIGTNLGQWSSLCLSQWYHCLNSAPGHFTIHKGQLRCLTDEKVLEAKDILKKFGKSHKSFDSLSHDYGTI